MSLIEEKPAVKSISVLANIGGAATAINLALGLFGLPHFPIEETVSAGTLIVTHVLAWYGRVKATKRISGLFF